MADALDRFVQAQNEVGTYARALTELRAGAKRSHWMWFVFPQLEGLGRSSTARHYAIRGADEARAYLAHQLLGDRLRTCTAAMLAWAGRRSAVEVLGSVDAAKFASSMTLFDHVDADPGSCFARALEAFCGGLRDPVSIALLMRDP